MTMTKKCSKCGVEKPFADFSKCKRWRDGYSYHCKNCQAQFNASWRKSEKGIASKLKSKARQRHHVRNKAVNAVDSAIRRGRLKKLDACEHCGSTLSLQGHHASYSKDMWLCVTWLCAICHKALHMQHNERMVAEKTEQVAA